jgi:hypothetical protein
MNTHSVLYAEDVSHYAIVEIEADGETEAIEPAKSHDFGDAPLEAEWSNAVCKRIVHIEDPDGKIVADDISLDSTFLHDGGDEARRICDNAEDMLKALEAAYSKDWVHNAAVTADIEALRKICLAHADWWNNAASPLIRKVKGGAA